MQLATNDVVEVNLLVLLMLLYKLLWLCTKIRNHFVIFVPILFPAYEIIRNSIHNNFYLKLFFMGCVFLAALSPQSNVFCCFSTLYFNHIHLSSPLASLRGSEFFVRNSIRNNFYFNLFLCVMLIFGSIES